MESVLYINGRYIECIVNECCAFCIIVYILICIIVYILICIIAYIRVCPQKMAAKLYLFYVPSGNES